MVDQRNPFWGVVMLVVLFNMGPVMENYSNQRYSIDITHPALIPLPDPGGELHLAEVQQGMQQLVSRAVPIRWS